MRSRLIGRLAPLLSAALIFVIYWHIGQIDPSWDTFPALLTSLSIVEEGNLDLDEFRDEFIRQAGPSGRPYYVVEVGGHLYSTFPIGAALLMVPVQLHARLLGRTIDFPSSIRRGRILGALLTAGSCAWLLSLLLRETPVSWAALVAAGYALGTSSLSVSSRALWQHGPAQFFLSWALWLAWRRPRGRPAGAGYGALLAAVVAIRPQDLLLTLPLLLIGGGRIDRRRAVTAYAAGLAALAAFNIWVYQTPLGGYGSTLRQGAWANPLAGALGLLVSPGRGLLVFSPFLILGTAAALGHRAGRSRVGGASWPGLVAAFVATLLLHGAFRQWWGGFATGPRFLADALPLLVVLQIGAASAWQESPAFRFLYSGALAWSVAVHLASTLYLGGLWNCSPSVDRHPERLWSLRDNPIVFAFTGRTVDSTTTVRLGPEHSLPPRGILPTTRPDEHFLHGWSPPTPGGRWMIAPRAYLGFWWSPSSRGRLARRDTSSWEGPAERACPGARASLPPRSRRVVHWLVRLDPPLIPRAETGLGVSWYVGHTRVGRTTFDRSTALPCQALFVVPLAALTEGGNVLTIAIDEGKLGRLRPQSRPPGLRLRATRFSISP